MEQPPEAASEVPAEPMNTEESDQYSGEYEVGSGHTDATHGCRPVDDLSIFFADPGLCLPADPAVALHSVGAFEQQCGEGP